MANANNKNHSPLNTTLCPYSISLSTLEGRPKMQPLCCPKRKSHPEGPDGKETAAEKMAQATALFRFQPKRPRSAKAPPINQKVAGSGVSAATSKVAPLAMISVAKKAPAE